jgi:hypothetical protein
MSEENQNQFHMRGMKPTLEALKSSEAIASGSSSPSRGKIRQFLRRFNVKSSKDSRGGDTAPKNFDINSKRISNPEVHVSHPGMEEGPDPQSVIAAPPAAREAARVLLEPAQNTPADLDDAYDFQDTYLKPLRIFDSTVVGEIADLHPYSRMALGVLSLVSKMILTQVDRDFAVYRLLAKLAEVYDFILQDETLSHISSKSDIVGRISQQTLECARFIRDYSETKLIWMRLGKNVGSETDAIIKEYSDVLDELMQQFRDKATVDVAVLYINLSERLDLGDMPYVGGAGLDTDKQCLPGTRTQILSEIIDWINTSGDDVPRVLWLSGPAGTGKSAIAHTIASWCRDVGVLGSCFCFDRMRDAGRFHEKMFFTIARDLADRDPKMRRALVVAVRDNSSLRSTSDIIQQWHKLLVEPLMKLSGSNAGPVVIVIDALDESGGVKTRHNLIRILAGELQNPAVPSITALPNNIRIIVTSRPLRDIVVGFGGAQHVLPVFIDGIPPTVTEGDIYTYVSAKLRGVSGLGGKEYAALAVKAGGLFEWARLACARIELPCPGSSPIDSFNAIMTNRHNTLLYAMYHLILTEVFGDTATNAMAIAKFRSVMGQIFGTMEPLPLHSLNTMRQYFPKESDRYNVDIIVESMGSLLSGTANSCTPIRPLHASFREFLTDPECSGVFFVDMSKVQRDLAFSSLRVMEENLRFNICDLTSSYLPNREDPQLPERVERCIPTYLAYASRFWAVHIDQTQPDTELTQAIKSFFEHERLLFWIEVLCLLNALHSGITALPLITKWLKCCSGREEVSSIVMDVEKFIQTFGDIILHSTPHLYVSAIPFSPINSAISRKFAARFPNTLCVAHGHLDLIAVQSVLSGHVAGVLAVSFSPDGTCIVTGLADKTVRLWNAATGQPLCEPLRGHIGAVSSVSFSPDGKHIASGSYDKTIRLWDVATRQPLGEPFRGHTHSITSVSFAPDGTRIATGSCDDTVRLWDVATRQPIGEPFRGHTARVNSVSFSPDGTRIVSGSSDNTVRMWDEATGQLCGEPLRGHTAWVNSVSFSPDGTCIASGSDDKTIRCGIQQRGTQSVIPCWGTLVWFHQLLSLGTELASRLVHMTKLFGCGTWPRDSHLGNPCRVTLLGLTQSHSRQMGLALCLVQWMTLSGSGMQQLDSHCMSRSAPRGVIEGPPLIPQRTILSCQLIRRTFPSHLIRPMRCATLVS